MGSAGNMNRDAVPAGEGAEAFPKSDTAGAKVGAAGCKGLECTLHYDSIGA
jgi:hypothetical protein